MNNFIILVLIVVLFFVVKDVRAYLRKGNYVYLVTAMGGILALVGVILSYAYKQVGDVLAGIGYSLFLIGIFFEFLEKYKGSN